jgi:hypothetical protein
MTSSTVNPAHQAFILTRLSEFCHYHAKLAERDPWLYMLDKLQQIEPQLAALKAELLAATGRQLLADIKGASLDAEDCGNYKVLLERLLSRGEFVDVAVHLNPNPPPEAAAWVERLLAEAKPSHVFIEERKPADERDPSSQKLVTELYARLGLDWLGRVLENRKRTPRRRALILRRLRRNVAEYCSVVQIPKDAGDTFTPFMLPRVEALIGACLRFLTEHR